MFKILRIGVGVCLSSWGNNQSNYQPTDYRLVEGAADEHGSLSFSQLLYRKRFGSWPCAAHDDAELNLYSPLDQALTFVIHTASNSRVGNGQASCAGGFFKGFVTALYRINFNEDNVAFSTIENANTDDLVGFRHGTGAITQVRNGGASDTEDNYEMLSKAIAGYNGADGWLQNHSYAKLIKYGVFNLNSARNNDDNGECHSCRYTIQAKEEFFGDNLRTYIWAGERNAETGEPAWCFAYGEREWIATVENEDGVIVPGDRFAQAQLYSERYQLGRPIENTLDRGGLYVHNEIIISGYIGI